jgi:hypothetical protein
MKSEVIYSETGLRPSFHVHGTAKDLPRNDSTDPINGFNGILERSGLLESQIEIIDPIILEPIQED